MARKKRKSPKRVAAGKKAARTRKRRGHTSSKRGKRRSSGGGVAALENRFHSIKKRARKDVSHILHKGRTTAKVKKLRGQIKNAKRIAAEARRIARTEARRIARGQTGPARAIPLV